MTKEVINIHIADVLEQIEAVEKLINMYKQTGHQDGSMFMIKQYSVRKEELVKRFSRLRNKASKFDRIHVSPQVYSYEPVLLSVANEETHLYNKKDNLT